MIYGIGNDIVDLKRLNNMLDKYSSQFLLKYFTPNEIAYAQSYTTKFTEKVASAWAVKEATAKALGTGIASGVRLQDIEVIRTQNGKPNIKLHGVAHTVAQDLVQNKQYNILVSISHDAHLVFTTVLIQSNK